MKVGKEDLHTKGGLGVTERTIPQIGWIAAEVVIHAIAKVQFIPPKIPPRDTGLP